jgi:hypothetical protein
VKITLVEYERQLGWHIASARALAAHIQGRGAAHGAPDTEPNPQTFEVVAARSEVAFWKLTGMHCRINAFILVSHLTDIDGDAIWEGGRYEVRSTEYATGHLIVHPTDNPDSTYVLCVVDDPVYSFPGYIAGRDAMVPEFELERDPRGERNFWVPQHRLIRWQT